MRNRAAVLDTDPEIERALIEEARAMQPWEKIKRMAELTEAHRQQLLTGLREKYPEVSEEELRMRFGIIWLGPEIVKKVYGWEFDD